MIEKIAEQRLYVKIQITDLEISDDDFLQVLDKLNECEQSLSSFSIVNTIRPLPIDILIRINTLLKNFEGSEITIQNAGLTFTTLAPVLNLVQKSAKIETYDLSRNPEIDQNCHVVILNAISNTDSHAKLITIDEN